LNTEEEPAMSPPRQCCEHRLNGLKKYLVGVAVAVTTAIVVQSASLLWWASAINVRVEYLEKDMDSLSVRVNRIETVRVVHP
jgi:hypothetical protein